VDVTLHEIFVPRGIYVLLTVEVVVDDSDEGFGASTDLRKYNVDSSL
jgi:hypothetical protein